MKVAVGCIVLLTVTRSSSSSAFTFLPTPRNVQPAVLTPLSTVAAVSEQKETAKGEVAKTEAKIMWEPNPDTIAETSMAKFAQSVGIGTDGSYDDLWKWSVDNSDRFWTELMDFVGIKYTGSTSPIRQGDEMPDVTYYPELKLNFAENMLRYGEPGSDLADTEALVSNSEARDDVRWTFSELRDDAARIASGLDALGVGADDACGAYMPNVGETIVAMLGTTSTGATWSSCSQDFGARAVADRFVQIGPKVLFTVDGFVSKGTPSSITDKVEELVEALPTLERVVVIKLLDKEPQWQSERVKSLVVDYEDFLS